MKLQGLADGLCGDFAHVGIAVSRGSESGVACASTEEVGSFEADMPFRVAWISKIVAGQVAVAVFGDLDVAMDEVLGCALRDDGAAVTLAQVVSHTSGLSDLGGYGLDPRLPLQNTVEGAIWARAPGVAFEYSNLGYILVAAAVEKKSGKPFGAVARDLGWPFAFNWFGASRDRVLPIFHRGKTVYIAQIDHDIGPPSGDGPVVDDPHLIDPELPTPALVGERRVGGAIGDDVAPGRQRFEHQRRMRGAGAGQIHQLDPLVGEQRLRGRVHGHLGKVGVHPGCIAGGDGHQLDPGRGVQRCVEHAAAQSVPDQPDAKRFDVHSPFPVMTPARKPYQASAKNNDADGAGQ